MNIFSRYLIRHLFIGYFAAALLLVPLFTLFDFISELEDVSASYSWLQALLVVIYLVPRCLVNLSPFIALLGGIVGLGNMSKNMELTAIRCAGFSTFRVAIVVLISGVMFTASLAIIDEWIASPLQQQAQIRKDTALAESEESDPNSKTIWGQQGDEFVRIDHLDKQGQPQGVEVFDYNADLTLKNYLYAQSATYGENHTWTLHNVKHTQWQGDRQVTTQQPSMLWASIFNSDNLKQLQLTSESYSIPQLKNYIHYLKSTAQPSMEYRSALWQKLGRPILVLAMVLLIIPFTFVNGRDTGMGNRLSLGVIVGLVTYIIYQICINLGLIFSITPLIAVIVPPVVMLIASVVLVYRFNERK
ncbi:LPS export ABC transporter permease LptG [Rosenbergiella australiborealis]|uniref:LPS export ABC transporter permease LptG n=1 Tax=Rosenbergiella australiborealis TaxID=1544696 RepID=A0ABS5T748_9GAMM|nr:LPS export ABC transporter permease LptG [Rosenbergiella australiborealis]MBT0728185.1 LPS export ABC transporter permease LptG [Rosenbergiella australiborealis]